VVWRLFSKDVRIFLSDRGGVIMTFLVPLVMIIIFGAAFGSMSGGDSAAISFLIADEDKSPETAKIVAEFGKDDRFNVSIVPAAKAVELVRKGKYGVAVVLPKGFSKKVASGEKLPLEFHFDPAKPIQMNIVRGMLPGVVMRALGDILVERMAVQTMRDQGYPAEAQQQALELMRKGRKNESSVGDPTALMEIKEVQEAGINTGNDSIAYSIAGICVMFLLFGVAYGGQSLLEEKESGTLRRLLISPTPPSASLLAKYLYVFVYGIVQLAVLLLFAQLIFGLQVVQKGFPLVAIIAALSAAAAGFGIALATICRTKLQVDRLATLIVLSMSAIGGCMVPGFLFPEWLKTLGHLTTINAWAMDGFQKVFWYGAQLNGILVEIGVLLAVAVVLIALSIALFNRRIASRI